MQNRYVGDVADFGKYGLLRFLSGHTAEDGLPPLALGVAWYLHPDRCGNADGKFVGYLQPTEANREQYRACDPGMWEQLGRLVNAGARCTHCVETAQILPDGTHYHTALHHYWPDMPRSLRVAVREHWLSSAIKATKDADLVLLDPDNGIADEAKMFLAAGPRYVYLSDIRRFWERDKSLVIYHHLGHNGKADAQIRDTADCLRDALGAEPIPLRFHRGTALAFFVIPQPQHRELIERRVGSFMDAGWGKHGHFSKVTLNNTKGERS